jgi:hypothetical protein
MRGQETNPMRGQEDDVSDPAGETTDGEPNPMRGQERFEFQRRTGTGPCEPTP